MIVGEYKDNQNIVWQHEEGGCVICCVVDERSRDLKQRKEKTHFGNSVGSASLHAPETKQN